MEPFCKTIIMTRKEWEKYLNDTPYGWTMSQSNEGGHVRYAINGMTVIFEAECPVPPGGWEG